MDDDEWDNVDESALKLTIIPAPKNEQKVTVTVAVASNNDDDEWDVPLVTLPSATPVSSIHSRVFTEDHEPVILILVDLTVLSNGSIHNQFDKHRYAHHPLP